MSILDHALAAAELGLKVFPIHPLSKKPPVHAEKEATETTPYQPGWQQVATTDPVQIQQWWAQNPRYNYGIRTGLENNLYVVDLDGPIAQDWWRSTGLNSTAVVTTPSGNDRTHLYFRTEDVELTNTQGGTVEKPVANGLHPHVDTRGEGGYVVGPGSILVTGSYRGDISNIPDIPAELVSLIPEKQVYVSVAREGDKVDEATESEIRQINSGLDALDALPRVWVEGAGWRSTFYRVACWFCRMVNSPDYALTEVAALELLLAHTPTDDQWGQAELLEQWHSAIKTTHGQFADVPTEHLPRIQPLLEVQRFWPDFTASGLPFLELWSTPDPAGSDWKRRRQILTECFARGMTVEQAGTTLWFAASATALQNDPHGLTVLWREVEKARLDHEAGVDVEAPAPEERAALTGTEKRISLLTDEERAFVQGDLDWFGHRYLDWVESRVSAMNAPYHRMSVWIILSLVFADAGFVPIPARPIHPIMFCFQVGPTTSGKTEARTLLRSVIRACFPNASPTVSANASENSLIEHLQKRDGQSTLMMTDEAQGPLKLMNTPGHWMAGLKDQIINLFDGEVGTQLRVGKTEDVKEAVTYFSTNFVGTMEGVSSALDEEFWSSGFGPRSIWAIGQRLDDPNADVAIEVEEYSAGSYDMMPKQWAAEFQAKRQMLKAEGVLPLAIKSNKDSLARQTHLQRKLTALAKGHKFEDILKPTFIRLGMTIRKAAILVAMSEGSAMVTMRHRLIAIEAGEEWLNNILIMVGATTAQEFRRESNEIERYIASQRDGMARPEKIYLNSTKDKFMTDRAIAQLAAEGRIVKQTIGNTQAFAWRVTDQVAA